ncbi:MAG: UDP-2,3-diacylglucosamine diphosphatase [Deltaproteobacteria bacterium]|nr:UDP-2,3-diacylglucosamine diphosphatase [Deltaproteobacteria bacterium]
MKLEVSQQLAFTVPSRIFAGLASEDEVDTLIVSDVHLGTDLCRPDALLTVLKSHTFRRLILLGDIFDTLDFQRLPRAHWHLLAYLRALCDPEQRIEVVWVEGNHDHLLSRVTRSFLGIPIHKRYEWMFRGQRFLALHGHQFDTFIHRHPIITKVACWVYETIQRHEGREHRYSRALKHKSKGWLRMSEAVATRAASYAARREVDTIFCGHTHRPLSATFGAVTYHNTGCWTDTPASFITIGARGVEVHEYH